ncbi:VCBS domain-containing protein, partial [Gilvimarinus agarilyticus]|uniref:VCBS domain-containing protein n=1 Tax=Gilvimarinus agarilyticus TaxID=679259 RepID=UPI001E29ED81
MGVNQLAITGTDSGSTTEDQTASTNGQLALTGAQGAQQWQVDTPTGQYGHLSIDASGQWSYQLDNGSTAVQSLAAAERVSDTFLITATSNGQSTQATITVDINGTNDGPALIPGAQVHALLDMANGGDASGTVDATDIDHQAQLSWSGVDQQGQFGHFHLDEATGQWHYQIDPTLPAAQALASGASASESFTLAVTDEHGSSAQQQIIVTVVGTNDAPVLATVPVQSLQEGRQPVSGQLAAQDLDGPGGLIFSSGFPVPGFSLSPDGHYSFNPGHSAYTPMVAGAVQQIDIPVKVTDPSGGSDTQTISIILTGTNQAPVVSMIAPLAVDEGDPTVHGQLQAVDSDTGDTVTFSAAQPTPGLTVNADGSFSFNPADSHYNSLSLGQSHTYTVAVTATDNHGASHTQDLVITLTGTNDVPVINAIAPALATEGGPVISGQIRSSDPDSPDTATYSGGQQVPGFNLNPDGSYSFDPSHSSYQSLAGGQQQQLVIPITVTDGAGGSDTQNLVIQLTGTNHAPVVNTIATQAVDEDAATISGQITGTDVDSGDSISYSIPGQPVDGLTLNADGNWSFNPSDPAYQHLPEGQQQVITVPVTGTDQTGATSTQSLVITLTGTNDAPTVATALTDQTATEDAAFSFAIPAGSFADIDTSDSLTLTASGMPAWAIFDASTGAFTGTPTNSDVGTTSVTVTATDAQGATVSTTFDLTVANTNDAPVLNPIATVTTKEDAQGISGQITATDSDAGDTLTYSSTATVAGLTLRPDGSYTFDPSNAAYQNLAEGQPQTLTIPVTVTDNQGLADTQNLVIKLTGTNDTPVLNSIAAQAVNEDAATITGTVTGADVDAGDTITYTSSPAVDGLTVNADGTWSFDPSHASYQSLGDGQPHTFTVTVTGTDQQGNSDTQDLTITLTGTNDAPTVTTALTGQATNQDTAFSFAIPAGTFTDIDTGDGLTLTTGNLPSWLSFDASTGTFTGTPQNADVGNTSITVTAIDNHGSTATSTFNLTVNNLNDAPVLNPISAVAVNEDGSQATGQLSATDPDTGDTLTFSASAIDGFTLHSDGSWSFDPSDAAYQSLPHNQTQKLTIPVTVTDAAGATGTQNLTITVTGTNDAASITGVDTGTVTEDQQVTNQGSLVFQGQLKVADVDAGEAVFHMQMQGAGSGGYGSFFVTQSGHWVYDVDNTNPAVQQLGDKQHLTDTYAVTSADGTRHTITVTIEGTNDAPVVSHAVVGQSATEDAVFHFSLPANTFADIDTGDSLSLSAGQLPAWLSFDAATGVFTGTPDNNDVGTTQISVTATDTQGVTVTTSFDLHVANTNDAPVLNQILQVTTNEDDAQISGQVSAMDPDAGDSLTYSTTATPAGFTLHTDGSWSFDPSNAAYQSLAQGQPHILTIPVIVQDASGATDQQNLTITLTGTNDAPVLSSIANVAANEGDAVVTGTLLGTDVDGGDSLTFFNTVPVPGLTIHADGSYSFDPGNRAYNHLPHNQQQVINVPITVADGHGGTDQQPLQITLTGTNDVPVVSGIDHAIGSIAAASGGKVIINGQLSIVDLDSGESHFQQQLIGGSYGVLNINQNGQWDYVADAHQPAFNQLQGSATLPETFMVRAADGTRHQIQLEIKGQGTPAIIGGVTLALVHEDQTGTITHQLAITDPNAGEAAFVPIDQATLYGHITLSAQGVWTYVLDNSNPAVQALKATDSVQDHVVVGSIDGTPQQISIHITGANDVAVIGGMSTGALTEDTGVGATGKLEASGQLSIADADTGEDHFIAVQDLPGDQGYGHFSIDTSGSWHYQIDNSQAAIQQLSTGSTPLTESTVVYSADGTRHSITITIQGSNDAPVVSHALVTQSATEDTAFTFSVPAGSFTDIDTGDTLTLSTGTLPGWLSFDASSGTFT